MLVSGLFRKFFLIGLGNAAFAYVFGVACLILLPQYLDLWLILLLVNIVCILFSFITQKKFVFRTSGNFMQELCKAIIVYGLVGFFSSSLVWYLLVEDLTTIFVAQFFGLAISTLISYFGHKFFTFHPNFSLPRVP
jgi:putative flippase GtrA